jgi:hypothetical protein
MHARLQWYMRLGRYPVLVRPVPGVGDYMHLVFTFRKASFWELSEQSILNRYKDDFFPAHSSLKIYTLCIYKQRKKPLTDTSIPIQNQAVLLNP